MWCRHGEKLLNDGKGGENIILILVLRCAYSGLDHMEPPMKCLILRRHATFHPEAEVVVEEFPTGVAL